VKSKILNSLLLITSLFGYLEWSGQNHSFLFQVEADIFSKLFTDPLSILHPLTILPMLGQLLLVVTLFQKTQNKTLTFVSMGCLGILLGLVLVIGLMSLNYKIIFSTIPFIATCVIAIKHYRKNDRNLVKK
jgi:uncharacterized protein YacL